MDIFDALHRALAIIEALEGERDTAVERAAVTGIENDRLKRMVEFEEGHPGMCCGQCQAAIVEAERRVFAADTTIARLRKGLEAYAIHTPDETCELLDVEVAEPPPIRGTTRHDL